LQRLNRIDLNQQRSPARECSAKGRDAFEAPSYLRSTFISPHKRYSDLRISAHLIRNCVIAFLNGRSLKPVVETGAELLIRCIVDSLTGDWGAGKKPKNKSGPKCEEEECEEIGKKLEGNEMRGKLLITSAALLLAGTLASAAQQQPQQPQEPRGEDSSRSSTPRGQLPGPDQTRGMRQGPSNSTGQSTPQEPRGEESSESSNPRGQQPAPRR
jgi:hypothetical protein